MSAKTNPCAVSISMKARLVVLSHFFDWKFKYEGDESVWSYIRAKRLVEEFESELERAA